MTQWVAMTSIDWFIGQKNLLQKFAGNIWNISNRSFNWRNQSKDQTVIQEPQASNPAVYKTNAGVLTSGTHCVLWAHSVLFHIKRLWYLLPKHGLPRVKIMHFMHVMHIMHYMYTTNFIQSMLKCKLCVLCRK